MVLLGFAHTHTVLQLQQLGQKGARTLPSCIFVNLIQTLYYVDRHSTLREAFPAPMPRGSHCLGQITVAQEAGLPREHGREQIRFMLLNSAVFAAVSKNKVGCGAGAATPLLAVMMNPGLHG